MLISYDGACKGNGTPECMSVGACVTEDLKVTTRAETLESTNQRGELNGVIEALKIAVQSGEPACIVTDSEFIFNTINKEWCLSWPKKGWISSTGNPIKNRDQWEIVVDLLDSTDIDLITMIYIKGHVLPFTKLVAMKELGLFEDENAVPNVAALHTFISSKYDTYYEASTLEIGITNLTDINDKSDNVAKAFKTTARINGYEMDKDLFKKCVCLNMVTDLMAGLALDKVVASSK